jgi:hypothetical protein
MTTGMLNLAAVNYRKDIPEFSGDLDDNTTFESWLKKANRVGVEAGWTEEQKLKFFQSKLRRAAAAFNNSLGVNIKTNLAAWTAAMEAGFDDATIQDMRRAQLSKVEQKFNERIREYRHRIDELYKSAYGRAAAESQDAEVIQLRNAVKKEALLKGMRLTIRTSLWNSLKATDTYEEVVEKAQVCEQVVDLRRLTEESEAHKKAEQQENEKNKNPELQQIMQAIANIQLSAGPAGVAAGTVAHISEQKQEGEKQVRFSGRSRSYSPRYRERQNPEDVDGRTRYYPLGQRSQSDNDWRQNRRQGAQETQPQRSNSLNRTPGNWDNQRNGGFPGGLEDRTCFFCKNKGHIKRACRKYQRWREENVRRSQAPRDPTRRPFNNHKNVRK